MMDDEEIDRIAESKLRQGQVVQWYVASFYRNKRRIDTREKSKLASEQLFL